MVSKVTDELDVMVARVLGEVDGWFGLSESPAHGPAH